MCYILYGLCMFAEQTPGRSIDVKYLSPSLSDVISVTSPPARLAARRLSDETRGRQSVWLAQHRGPTLALIILTACYGYVVG